MMTLRHPKKKVNKKDDQNEHGENNCNRKRCHNIIACALMVVLQKMAKEFECSRSAAPSSGRKTFSGVSAGAVPLPDFSPGSSLLLLSGPSIAAVVDETESVMTRSVASDR